MADLTTDSAVSDANPIPQTRILGIFAKAWDAGKVKTRLAKTLGNETAAQVYLELLKLHLVRFAHVANCHVVAYSPADEKTKVRFRDLAHSLEELSGWELVPQVERDLGTRMSCFFNQQFESNAERSQVVLIGSDTPRLSIQIVDKAFESLKLHDVVFGPSADGGYYLVGLKSMADAVFKGVDWSTEKVLQQSLEICEREGLSVALLPELNDIDDEADLKQELELLETTRNDDSLVEVFLDAVTPLLDRKPS